MLRPVALILLQPFAHPGPIERAHETRDLRLGMNRDELVETFRCQLPQ